MTDSHRFVLTYPSDGSVLDGLAFDVEPRAAIAVFGPNGAGKTSMLRTMAGVVPGARRTESVAYLPQQPHLFAGTVGDNYHLGNGNASHAAAIGEELGIGDLLGVDVSTLSVGQAHRAAIARVLSGDERLVVLDEPLAPIDVVDRARVVGSIKHATADRALVTVTHSPEDAALLATELVVLDAGKILQQGPVASVLREPVSERVASIVGVSNVYSGTVAVHGEGVSEVIIGDSVLIVPTDSPDGTDVVVRIPPESIGVFAVEPHDSSYRNVINGEISSIRQREPLVEITVGGALPMTALVTPGSMASLDLEVGSAVWFGIKTAAIHVEQVG